MQDRPDAPELLLAVAQWLVEDLLPVAPREQRFNVRVAAHTCAMVAREWEGAADAPAEEERRLRSLGAEGEDVRALQRDLAAAIRRGELDERFEETLEVLGESVRARLAVAHPGWDQVADAG